MPKSLSQASSSPSQSLSASHYLSKGPFANYRAPWGRPWPSPPFGPGPFQHGIYPPSSPHQSGTGLFSRPAILGWATADTQPAPHARITIYQTLYNREPSTVFSPRLFAVPGPRINSSAGHPLAALVFLTGLAM